MGRIKGDLLRVGNTRRDWCSGRAWSLGARGGGGPGRERTYHLRRRCPMVKREAGMEEEDEGAVVHDFRAQARARASPSSTELWDSTELVHLTLLSKLSLEQRSTRVTAGSLVRVRGFREPSLSRVSKFLHFGLYRRLGADIASTGGWR